MHLLYEVFPERDEEQDSQDTSEQGGKEHLHEIDFHSEDVDGRESEYGSCHNGSGAASYGLDDHVLSQSFLLSERGGEADCYDGDRYGGLEDLANPEAKVGCSSRKDHYHQ